MNLLDNLEDWRQVPGPFQFRNLLQLVNNQLCLDSNNSFFGKNEWETTKNGKFQHLKLTRSPNIVILMKS